MKNTLAIMLILASFSAQASWKEKIREFLLKYVGQEKTEKILGVDPDKVRMPVIPEIKTDSKSVSVYEYKDIHTAYDNFKKDKKHNFNLLYLREIYPALKRRKPYRDEMSLWMNALSQGSSREGIFRAIILDDEYAEFEGKKEKLNEDALAFLLDYARIYLELNIKKKSIKSMNAFTLNRIILDKTLNLIDVLKLKRDDLESWYALFSKTVAGSYSHLFSSKVRTTADAQFQKRWAHTMPVDIIKSEVIIKFSKVFHSLQKK